MTRRGRSILKAVLALFVLAVVLVSLGYFPQDVVRRYVEQRIQNALGPGSRIRRMHVVPGRLTTEAYDLVIEGPTYRQMKKIDVEEKRASDKERYDKGMATFNEQLPAARVQGSGFGVQARTEQPR